MRITKRSQYLLEYILLRLFCGVVKLLPARFSISAGRALGALCYRLIKKRGAVAHHNLNGAYGQSLTKDQRDRIIRTLLSMLGEAFIESIIVTPQDLKKNIAVQGREHLEKALQLNRGVIMLVPHFGIWELASHVFGMMQKNSSVIYKPLKNTYIDAYVKRIRLTSNISLIPSKQALRSVMGNLKKGRVVGILFDQNAGRAGVPVSFFGKTALTHSAPAVFALRTRCPVLPAYMMRGSGFRQHRLVIQEPFPLIDTGDYQRDILANTQQYNDFLEDLVRRAPEEWFGWLHRRWKLPRSM